LNILTQYHSGAVKLGGSFIDTRAYPIDFGTNEPLTDDDIRYEIVYAIRTNNWKVDNNSIVFVMTGVFQASGAPVEECGGDVTWALVRLGGTMGSKSGEEVIVPIILIFIFIPVDLISLDLISLTVICRMPTSMSATARTV
jgi:hypothetical protein